MGVALTDLLRKIYPHSLIVLQSNMIQVMYPSVVSQCWRETSCFLRRQVALWWLLVALDLPQHGLRLPQ